MSNGMTFLIVDLVDLGSPAIPHYSLTTSPLAHPLGHPQDTSSLEVTNLARHQRSNTIREVVSGDSGDGGFPGRGCRSIGVAILGP